LEIAGKLGDQKATARLKVWQDAGNGQPNKTLGMPNAGVTRWNSKFLVIDYTRTHWGQFSKFLDLDSPWLKGKILLADIHLYCEMFSGIFALNKKYESSSPWIGAILLDLQLLGIELAKFTPKYIKNEYHHGDAKNFALMAKQVSETLQ
jgi:hypothetical protein